MKTNSTHSLMLCLKRRKFPQPGSLSRLLLKAFAEDGGLIVGSKWSVELGLDDAGDDDFSKLRTKLKNAQFLSWNEDVKKCRYQPGENFMKYLNRHLMEIQQFASKADLNAVKSRQDSTEDEITSLKHIVKEHDARFLKLEAIVAELEEVIGPPDTPERRKKRSSLTSDLNKHIKSN